MSSLPNLDIGLAGCGVLASGWYDADDIHLLLDAIVRGRTETEIQRLVTVGIDAVIFPLMGLSGVAVSQVSCVIDGAPGCTHLVEWQ
jgi:hypothetical protein